MTKQKYRLPAEWEPQEAIWISWPLNPLYWPDLREKIETDFVELAALISRYQLLRINCLRPAQDSIRNHILSKGGKAENLEFFDIATNDAWCRDHGPIFLKEVRTGDIVVGDFPYNAWGGKFPADLDNLVPARIGEVLGLKRLQGPMVLEGGSIDSNGEGLLLTTEACLLNPNRNPHLNKKQIEAKLQEWLGVDQVLWLGDGLEGDDTDGHIDDLSRFYSPRGVVTAIEANGTDANSQRLRENRERLLDFRFPDGGKLDVVDLPMPEPIRDDTRRYPASYANFLILNEIVIVPIFKQKTDAEALEILKNLFPGRKVVGFDCRRIIQEGGAVHCLTMQQPE